ncbi:MAG: hypothetical protein LBK82_14005 [Planctomycetaceae bacterium]|jgi:hypothetical protein|nr:hypothetical protein [Planctomycetaceae bacterium]
MKQILRSVIFIAVLLVVCNTGYSQGMKGQHKPYQNLAKWYGTQSAPTMYEKAQWALDDINVYRAENGLTPLSENILKTELQNPRFQLFKIFRRK